MELLLGASLHDLHLFRPSEASMSGIAVGSRVVVQQEVISPVCYRHKGDDGGGSSSRRNDGDARSFSG